MSLLVTAETTLHVELHGDGEPVTLFTHGVASSVEDVRFLASGVVGTRAFVDLRGHGRSGVAHGVDAWGYRAVTRDLVAAADHVGASRCVGMSLGAGAILGAVAAHPSRFDRIVLVLPAGLDEVRPADPDSDLARIARLAEAGDREGLATLLGGQLPPDIAAARGVPQLMRRRAASMCRAGVPESIRALPSHAPVRDRSALASYAGRALVIGHEGDDLHPAGIARQVAAALPGAQLHLFEHPWSMLRERAALRRLISGFLAG